MLTAFFIFIIVFILYIHIQAQYKKGEDLEIYEMDYSSRKHLQTVCDMKQPVLFTLALPENVIEKEPQYELPIWDIREYSIKDSVDPFSLSYDSFIGLAKSDPKRNYFTRKNSESFDINKQVLDEYLQPPLLGCSDYELCMGSTNASLPLQYHMDDRRFLFVKKGRISVKMTTWKEGKNIDCICDYENYEFFSQTNIWMSKSTNLKHVRWLEFEVSEGYVLYIPPWWWYSIRFHSVETEVIGIRYNTFANIIAHIPNWARYYIHLYSTKNIPLKILETGQTGNHSDIPPEEPLPPDESTPKIMEESSI